MADTYINPISSSVKHYQEPPHLHMAVQVSGAFMHLQFAWLPLAQPQRNSTLQTVHAPGDMGLTPHNVSLPSISALYVMIASVKSLQFI